jgi:hypothetical protein
MKMCSIRLGIVITLCLIFGQKGEADLAQKGILSVAAHEQNQRLCSRIVDQFLFSLPASYTPQQRAHALNVNLHILARQLLDQGVNLSAYNYCKIPNSPYLSFARISLWEGGSKQPEIPLTLFIYVWPPEHIAKQIAANIPLSASDPSAHHYATNIHGHPLPCALTLLRGSLCQENYQAVRGWPFNVAQKKNEETLQFGTAAFDDNTTPFIHRVCCRDKGEEPAISLHGYGASTEQAVLSTFIAERERYSYPYVLQANGDVIYQPW